MIKLKTFISPNRRCAIRTPKYFWDYSQKQVYRIVFRATDDGLSQWRDDTNSGFKSELFSPTKCTARRCRFPNQCTTHDCTECGHGFTPHFLTYIVRVFFFLRETKSRRTLGWKSSIILLPSVYTSSYCEMCNHGDRLG